MIFREITLEDKALFDRYLIREDSLSDDYCFSNLYLWAKIYGTTCAVQDGWLLIRNRHDGLRYSLAPLGEGDLSVPVALLRDQCAQEGIPLRFGLLTAEQRDRLEAAMPGRFEFTPQRDSFDYVYSVEKLAELAGRRLHSKRNHINRFMDENADWNFEPLSNANLEEAHAMHRAWCRENGCQSEAGLQEEDCAVARAFAAFGKLDLMGGLLRVAGRVVAYTMASPLGLHSMDVHFEKAFTDPEGAYAVINCEMAQHVREAYPDVVYLNREDDTGDEGLRRAKESYLPDVIVEKFSAALR